MTALCPTCRTRVRVPDPRTMGVERHVRLDITPQTHTVRQMNAALRSGSGWCRGSGYRAVEGSERDGNEHP